MTTNKLSPRLDTIIAAKQRALKERRKKTPLEALRALASMQNRPNPILSTVPDPYEPVIIIGQIKHTLSQQGQIVYDPVGTALRYVHRGVDSVSLFTDEIVYENGLDDLVLVSKAVQVPVICQDYILDEYEVIEARAAGASALVLSAAVLDRPTLRALISNTQRNRMTAIVQVHNREQLDYALSLSPHVIGLSSDNPLTPEPELDLEATRRLRSLIPSHIRVMVMEKLHSLDQVDVVASLDVDAVLVDERLLEIARHADTLRARFNAAEHSRS